MPSIEGGQIMPDINVSQLSALQIVTAFFIVSVALIAVGAAAPKIINSAKNISSLIQNMLTRQQEKKKKFMQIETNTMNIAAMSQKIDSLLSTLNQFVMENKEINREIISQLEDFREEQLQKQLDDMRAFVLSFANSLKTQPDVRHTVKEYLNVIDIGTKYHSIIEEKGLENGAFDMEFGFIKRDYNKRLDTRDFLNMEEDICNEKD